MTTKEIEELLQRYYEGLTTLEEENQLKNYFSGDAIPKHLQPLAEQFRFFDHASKEEINNPSFEEDFFEKVLEKDHKSKVRNLTPIYYSLSTAAAVLLFVGVYFMFKGETRTDLTKTSIISSNEVSYLQTKEILMNVSLAFNKGVDEIKHLQKFEGAVDKAGKVSKFFQYESLIINQDQSDHRSIKSEKQ